MSSLSQNFVKANPLVIASISVRQDEEGRYCLNDLQAHRIVIARAHRQTPTTLIKT